MHHAVTEKNRIHYLPIAAAVLFLLLLFSGDARAEGLRRTRKYYRVYVVGDSRTMYMKKHVEGQAKKTTFIYKNGGGLAWFEQHGFKFLMRGVNKYAKKAKKAGKPIAVVLNWGVNTLGTPDRYAAYYRKIAKPLLRRGCRLFVMSVNPCDPARARACGHLNIPQSAGAVPAFNRRLKAGTRKNYTWIDTYSYLMKEGWVSGGGIPGGDGLHYQRPTSIKIYNYMIAAIDAAAKKAEQKAQ